MDDDSITLERIDELLQFLPRLSGDGVTLGIGFAGGEQIADNVFTAPYPVYPDDVFEFFLAAGQRWWADYDYVNHPASRRLEDADFIAGCSMDELRTMLTACVRGERFADGYWFHCLESGIIERLLRRLAELRDATVRDDRNPAPPSD